MSSKDKKTLICVPSKNRPNYSAGKFFTEYALFLEPQDVLKYPKDPKATVVRLDKDNMGFGYVLNFMVNYASKNGYKYIFFCDDDVYGFNKVLGMRSAKLKRADCIVRHCESIAEKGFAQVGVVFAGQSWFKQTSFEYNKAIWGVGLYNVKDIISVGGYLEAPTLHIFNDYEITARLLISGKWTIVSNVYSFSHKMASKSGGASDVVYKHIEKKDRIEKSINYLIERYGSFVRPIWSSEHGQPEVRFDWTLVSKLKP